MLQVWDVTLLYIPYNKSGGYQQLAVLAPCNTPLGITEVRHEPPTRDRRMTPSKRDRNFKLRLQRKPASPMTTEETRAGEIRASGDYELGSTALSRPCESIAQ